LKPFAHRWRRRELLKLGCGLAAGLALAPRAPADERDVAVDAAVKTGFAWLLAQQAEDGGWHSSAYGALKGGAAITSLVLYTVAQLPQALWESNADRWRRAFAFFAPGLEKRQTLAAADGSLDYPTYAVPMWLVASEQLKQPQPPALRKQLVEYLIAAQLCESRGFDSQQAVYGGWDFLGAADAQGITTGSSISVLAYAVEAIAASNHPSAAKALKRAADWLFRCQDACRDGGFAFTPEPMSLNNKAEFRDARQSRPRSYGSATVDGLRALLACGIEPSDQRVQQAVQWLAKHSGLEVVPGFDDLPLELGWQRGLRYYYLAGLSRALPTLPAAERTQRASQIAKALVGEQKSDGNWQSDAPRMREDDPLIATCFVLTALGHLLKS
jgi:hypothetical protein